MKDYLLLDLFHCYLFKVKIGYFSAYIGKSPAYKELVSAYREVHPHIGNSFLGIRQIPSCTHTLLSRCYTDLPPHIGNSFLGIRHKNKTLEL